MAAGRCTSRCSLFALHAAPCSRFNAARHVGAGPDFFGPATHYCFSWFGSPLLAHLLHRGQGVQASGRPGVHPFSSVPNHPSTQGSTEASRNMSPTTTSPVARRPPPAAPRSPRPPNHRSQSLIAAARPHSQPCSLAAPPAAAHPPSAIRHPPSTIHHPPPTLPFGGCLFSVRSAAPSRSGRWRMLDARDAGVMA
jgi:hypothetical protein